MKLFKRFLMGLGTVLLLALSLQLVAPKAVHAVVSTLVTVANTAANPVPTHSVDSPPLLQTFSAVASCNVSGLDQTCHGNLLTVPLGMTAVVTDVSGVCDLTSVNGATAPPPGNLYVASAGSGLDGGRLLLSSVFQYADASADEYVFGRQTNVYFQSTNAGQAVIYFNIESKSPNNTDCGVIIGGYYIASNAVAAVI